MAATHFQDGEDWEALLKELIPQLRMHRAGALDTTDAYVGTTNEDVPSAVFVLALSGDARLDLADVEVGKVCGISLGTYDSDESCKYVTRGFVFVESWYLATGSVQLVAGRTYFLRDRGKLSLVPPESGYVIPIGQAQTEYIFDVSIGTKIRL